MHALQNNVMHEQSVGLLSYVELLQCINFSGLGPKNIMPDNRAQRQLAAIQEKYWG